MVKRFLTSIITVAVLMGVLVACSGSDSEVAELRAELEELKEAQNNEPSDVTEKVPEPTPTPQTFFEYPEYGISIDFSTNEGADRLLALTQCESDWNTILRLVETTGNEVGKYNSRNGLRELNSAQLSLSDFDYLISAHISLRTLLLEDGRDLIGRLGACERLFEKIFDARAPSVSTGSAAAMVVNFIDKCAELKNRGTYAAARAENDYFLAVWFEDYCYDYLDYGVIPKVNERFEDLHDWAVEVQTARGER